MSKIDDLFYERPQSQIILKIELHFRILGMRMSEHDFFHISFVILLLNNE